jgi:hypothetical protein
MSRRRWKFAPCEVKRAISVVREAGLGVSEVEIAPDGSIHIHTTDSATTVAAANEWDEDDAAALAVRS